MMDDSKTWICDRQGEIEDEIAEAIYECEFFKINSRVTKEAITDCAFKLASNEYINRRAVLTDMRLDELREDGRI